jgi:hypothetical protein
MRNPLPPVNDCTALSVFICLVICCSAELLLVYPCVLYQVPVNVLEDRLFGSVDVKKTLETGDTVFTPGTCCAPHFVTCLLCWCVRCAGLCGCGRCDILPLRCHPAHWPSVWLFSF